jgi:hypothetical protein
MIKYTKEDIDRFYNKITVIENGKNAGCWEISYAKDRDGYSKINIKGKNFFCHRFMYQIWHPDKDIDVKTIMHSCDNPGCVCPNHLSSGTMQDNVNDCVLRNRQAKGSKNGNSKLTENDIEEILVNTLSGYFVNYPAAKACWASEQSEA